MTDEDVVVAPALPVPTEGATVVVVAYGVHALNLDWVPASVPVVIVHNDDHLATTAIDRPAVTHLFPGTNVGFGAGVNAALDQINTARVVLCNPDIRAELQHWAALQSDDPNELVVVDQVDAAEHPTSVVNRYPTPAAVLLTALRASRIAPRGSKRRQYLARLLGQWGKVHADSLHSIPRSVPAMDRHYRLAEHWPSAALVSIDTALLRAVGGFDEGYFLYWEDVDLAHRLAVAAPEATVKMSAMTPAIHLVGGSVADAATRHAVRHHRWRSALRYAKAQPGARWRLITAVLRLGSALTASSRGTANTQPPRLTRPPEAAVPSRTSGDVGSRPIVAVVHATRRASGETRRLSSWLELLEAAGFDPEPVTLLGNTVDSAPWGPGSPEHGHERPASGGARLYSWSGWRAIGEVASGQATPETLAWNHRRATMRLEELNPRAVICVTLRAFSPAWTKRWPVVIDLVDPLSKSYRQRSGLARSPWRRSGFSLLAWAAARAEGRSRQRTATVAAGWTDARRLGVPWIPNIVPAAATSTSEPATRTDKRMSTRWQALFVGSLDYPPNIEAVERLATSIWPKVMAQRPGALLGIAGRRPAPGVLDAAQRPGVELIGEFTELADLVPWTQTAVSPLRHATGFQNKVLDAALAGLPQVVSPAALAGFEPGLKVRVGDSDDEIVDSLMELLKQPAEAEALATEAGAQVRASYGVARWAPVVRSLLDELRRPGDNSTTQTLVVKSSRT